MIKIVICDDNKIFSDTICGILDKYAGLYGFEVRDFDNGEELLRYCRSSKVDIIYMDIEVGSENGMELAKKIKTFNPYVLIIYVSAYDYYYVDMVQAEPFRFVHREGTNFLKYEKEIVDALEAAIRRINGKDVLTFVFNKKQYTVLLESVKYFHSIARTIHIVGNSVGKPDYYYGKLDELQCELDMLHCNFQRINKSCIVNMEYAKLVSKTKVKIGEKSFTITHKYLESFMEQYKGGWFIV